MEMKRMHPLSSRLRGLTLLLTIGLIFCLGQKASAAERLLVVRLPGATLDTLVQVISQELREDFKVYELTVDSASTKVLVKNKMEEVKPRITILMDNLPIALYKEYQKSLPDSLPVVPSVSLMAVNIDRMLKGMRNATGIRYEIPVVTSAVNLRFLLNAPMEKVGVVCREFMGTVIEKNREYCDKEGIHLVPYTLPNEKLDFAFSLRKGLKELFTKEKVNALWVINDNVLLVPSLIENVWAPMAKKYKIPVIVGVEALVKPELDFGTYAVLPEHRALGSQVSEIVYAIMDNNWSAEGRSIQPPVAVYDIVNLNQLSKRLSVRPEKLGEVDRILK